MKKKTWIALCLVVALAMANVIGAGAADIAADGTKETEQMGENVISDDADEVMDGETEADEQSKDGIGSTGEAVDSGENAGTGQDGEDEAAGLGLMGINGLPQEDEDGGIPMAVDNGEDQNEPSIGFSVAVTPQGKVEAGKEATFDVKIRNVTQETLKVYSIWHACYNWNDNKEPEDFGTLKEDSGDVVADPIEGGITFNAGESKSYTLTGTIPGEWNEDGWHILVSVTGETEDNGQIIYYNGSGYYPINYWDFDLSMEVTYGKSPLDVDETTTMKITIKNNGIDDINLKGCRLVADPDPCLDIAGATDISIDWLEKGKLIYTFGDVTVKAGQSVIVPKEFNIKVNGENEEEYIITAGELYNCIYLYSPNDEWITECDAPVMVSEDSAPIVLEVTLKPGFDVNKAVKGETYPFEVMIKNPSSKGLKNVDIMVGLSGLYGDVNKESVEDVLSEAKMDKKTVDLVAGESVTVKGTITIPSTINVKKYEMIVLNAYVSVPATDDDSAYIRNIGESAFGFDQIDVTIVDGSSAAGAQTGSAAASNAGGVQTGDMAPITTLMVLMAVSAMAASVAWRKRSAR